MTETKETVLGLCFEHLNLGHCVLPFDVAQGGELAEPFRISPASP